jgi:hypothetical protein
VGVGTDLHRPRRLALVAERVHVADDREGDLGVGLLEHVDRTDVDHLVHGGGERDRRPGHRGETRAPHAAGDGDVLGLDPPLVRHDGPDRTVVDLEVDDLGVGEHGEGALVDRLLTHQRARLERVDDRDRRGVEAAEQDVGVGERDQLLDLRRRQQPGLDAPRLGRRHPPLELLDAHRVAGDLDPTARRVDAELDVLALALQGEQRHLLVVVGREDEVRSVAGRAARVGERALVDEYQVGPAEPGEVPDEAVADDAGADHDAAGRGGRSAHVGDIALFRLCHRMRGRPRMR